MSASKGRCGSDLFKSDRMQSFVRAVSYGFNLQLTKDYQHRHSFCLMLEMVQDSHLAPPPLPSAFPTCSASQLRSSTIGENKVNIPYCLSSCLSHIPALLRHLLLSNSTFYWLVMAWKRGDILVPCYKGAAQYIISIPLYFEVRFSVMVLAQAMQMYPTPSDLEQSGYVDIYAQDNNLVAWVPDLKGCP